MSRSNSDKPFYVDVGTSVVAVRCASNHDVVLEYDHSRHPFVIELAEKACDRMNKEAEIGRHRRNCDVGTAKEQTERFGEFCKRNYAGGERPADCQLSCPLSSLEYLETECPLAWAQMPYEEGGAK